MGMAESKQGSRLMRADAAYAGRTALFTDMVTPISWNAHNERYQRIRSKRPTTRYRMSRTMRSGEWKAGTLLRVAARHKPSLGQTLLLVSPSPSPSQSSHIKRLRYACTCEGSTRPFTSRVGQHGCARLALSTHVRSSCSKYCFIIANVRRFSLRMGRTIIGCSSASTPESRGVVVR